MYLLGETWRRCGRCAQSVPVAVCLQTLLGSSAAAGSSARPGTVLSAQRGGCQSRGRAPHSSAGAGARKRCAWAANSAAARRFALQGGEQAFHPAGRAQPPARPPACAASAVSASTHRLPARLLLLLLVTRRRSCGKKAGLLQALLDGACCSEAYGGAEEQERGMRLTGGGSDGLGRPKTGREGWGGCRAALGSRVLHAGQGRGGTRGGQRRRESGGTRRRRGVVPPTTMRL